MGGFPLGSKLEIELPRELLNMEVLSINFFASTTRIEMYWVYRDDWLRSTFQNARCPWCSLVARPLFLCVWQHWCMSATMSSIVHANELFKTNSRLIQNSIFILIQNKFHIFPLYCRHLYWAIEGAVVLVHGLLCSRLDMAHFAEELVLRGFTVLAPATWCTANDVQRLETPWDALSHIENWERIGIRTISKVSLQSRSCCLFGSETIVKTRTFTQLPQNRNAKSPWDSLVGLMKTSAKGQG